MHLIMIHKKYIHVHVYMAFFDKIIFFLLIFKTVKLTLIHKSSWSPYFRLLLNCYRGIYTGQESYTPLLSDRAFRLHGLQNSRTTRRSNRIEKENESYTRHKIKDVYTI